MLAAWALLSAVAHGGEMRVFHSAEGKALKASFVSATGDLIKLRREDGKTFELAKDKLSAADQAYLAEITTRAAEAYQKLNTAAGHAITDGSPFSERKAEALAKALQLQPESQSKYGRSWRLYAAFAKDYRLFGAMPYSVALYSDAAGLRHQPVHRVCEQRRFRQHRRLRPRITSRAAPPPTRLSRRGHGPRTTRPSPKPSPPCWARARSSATAKATPAGKSPAGIGTISRSCFRTRRTNTSGSRSSPRNPPTPAASPLA